MEKKTLSEVIEANEVAQFNGLITNLAYMTTQLTTRIDTLAKELSDMEDTLELVLAVGEDAKSTVADLQEVINVANKALYNRSFDKTVIHGGAITTDKIVAGSITANKITTNSIAATVVSPEKITINGATVLGNWRNA